jgi:type II restriction/modification system DNA methylase subunit YeeA
LINYLYTELNTAPASYQKIGEDQTQAFDISSKDDQLDLTIEHRLNPAVPKEDIETLILHGEHLRENDARVAAKGRETKDYAYQTPVSIRRNAALIDEKLAAIRVCDPAVGSGAFPVGMMSEIVRAREVLKTWTKTNKTTYDFKRECIENSLYGVDIDAGAVEIAKLRLWLSLVVDEDDPQNIKPLPNLDYKIVCGNSLLGFPDNFTSPIGEEIESLKHQHVNETNPTKKDKFKTQIDEKIQSRYKNSLSVFGYQVNFDFKTVFSEVFRLKKGFDVVIGNPPYVEAKKLKDVSKTLCKFYSTYSGTADLYVYFYENGIKQLNKNGTLIFITSNKFIKTSYGENLRKYFTGFRINEIVDFTDIHVFEALVASCIFSVSKSKVPDNKFSLNKINSIYPKMD